MIKVLDLQRNVTAILENAYAIGYEKVSNQIWSASFSLPLNDPKVKKVELLKYVEISDGNEYIGLFRIIPKKTLKNESTQEVNFQCEHVLATLLNSTLFKYHQLTNYYTKEVLQYLLDRQKEKHWKIGTVEISRRFSYNWENENLLSAIFSVPKPFDEQYRWTWDTTSYPWTLNLVKPEMEPTCRIREKHNLVGFELEENPMSMYNRIYPLGYGEGVNQLTIESVNNKIPYIEDAQSVAENEVFETVWVDRTIKNPSTLKANALALLKKWKEPIVTWSVTAADVSTITKTPIDKLKEGKVVRLQIDGFPETDLRIMKESKPDIKGSPWDVQLEIGNITEDLSTTQSDLERRQQINDLVAQGATNILNSDRVDNADPEHPIKFRVRIPEEAVNINYMELTYETDNFRGYTRGMKAGGAYIKESQVESKSTEGGGAYVRESQVEAKTTSAGGAYTKDSTIEATSTAAGGDHRHRMFRYGGETPPSDEDLSIFSATAALDGSGAVSIAARGGNMDLYTDTSSGDHTHQVNITIPGINIEPHTHGFSVTIPAINIPEHTHNFSVTIPAIDIPPHTHEQEYGIYEHDTLPSKLEIKVDGTIIPFDALEGENIDLLPYLAKDSEGRVQRNRFAEIEIRPVDELAQISATVIWGLFIQSRKGTVV